MNKRIQQFTKAEVERRLPVPTTTIGEICPGQQQLNANLIIRCLDLKEDSSEAELLAVYNGIRTYLGVSEINELNPVSVKRLPYSREKVKNLSSRPLQINVSSTAAKRQFLQVRRIKKEIYPSDIGVQQQVNKPVLITEQLT